MKLTQLNLVLCLAAVLCGVTNQDRVQADASKEMPTDTVISLERTMCFGSCPVYKLTISADGTVVFEGIDYVKKKGMAKRRINKEKLAELISEFEKINYFSLRDTYRNESDGCTTYATDMPWANTSIQMNGRKKSVSHYLGCWGGNGDFKIQLKELITLESKIDEIAGTKKWVK